MQSTGDCRHAPLNMRVPHLGFRVAVRDPNPPGASQLPSQKILRTALLLLPANPEERGHLTNKKMQCGIRIEGC